MTEDRQSVSRRTALGFGAGLFSIKTLFSNGRSQESGGGERAAALSETTADSRGSVSAAAPDPRVGTDLGDAFEWFEDDDRWSARGDGRCFLDDGGATPRSPTPARGEASLGVTADSAPELVGDFSDDPLDFSENSLSLGIYAEAPEEQPTLYAFLDAPDRDNAVRYKGAYPGGHQSGWQRIDMSVDDVAGDPDLSAVESVRIRVASDESTRFWLDDLRAMPRPDRGKVMLMFDDIKQSQYDIGYDVLSGHGLRGAYAVITGFVGDSDRISMSELNAAEEDGWELVSHSVNGDPLTKPGGATRREHLAESQRWLREHAENPEAAEHLVFPLSAYSEAVLEDAAETYEMSYVGGRGSSAALSDHRTVVRENWEKMDDDQLLDAIDQAAERRELLVYIFHGIDPEERARLEKLASYLSEAVEEGRVDNVTPTELSSLQARLGD